MIIYEPLPIGGVGVLVGNLYDEMVWKRLKRNIQLQETFPLPPPPPKKSPEFCQHQNTVLHKKNDIFQFLQKFQLEFKSHCNGSVDEGLTLEMSAQ